MGEATGVALADFETNDESQLDTVVEEGGNTFTVGAGGALHGSYGATLEFDGTNNDCYGEIEFAETDEMYARMYIKFGADFGCNTSLGTILALRDSSGVVVYLTTYDSGTGLTWRRFYYTTDSGSAFVALGDAISLDTTYLIEIHFKAATGAGNNDGQAHCWINGVSEASVENIDNDTEVVNRCRFGGSGAQIPTDGSLIYIDDCKLDTSYIGAYSAAAGTTYIPQMMAYYARLHGD